MDGLFAILGLAAIGWFWMDALRAREITLSACNRVCADIKVQLLDQTVAVRKLTLVRDALGRPRVCRWYGFEFSTRGDDRHAGVAILRGHELAYVHMEHPDGAIIIDDPINGAGRLH